MIFLDTHVVVWLYENNLEMISKSAQEKISNNDLFISPMAYLEIEYLYEIERIKKSSRQIVDDLKVRIGVEVDFSDFFAIFNISINEKWTRDPFDRLIVSQAKFKESCLITKDKKIIDNYHRALS